MSVMVVTSLGEMVMDLFTDQCPLTTKNFLKLCKIKYYNGCLFHTVQKDFTAQTGDPSGTGSGGDSTYKFLYGEQARFFEGEIRPDLKHKKMGTVAMASTGDNMIASQFYITLRDDLDYLDEKHTVFGEVVEGHDTLMRINDAYVDEKGRPFKNIRIKHTYVLDDPFEDPSGLADLIPDASPQGKPKEEVDDEVRLEDDWVPMDEQLAPEQLEEVIRTKEAHSRAVVLESIGDFPDAEIKPPENVLFVCKLNPVTEDDDLHTIFSRFGTVTSAEIIRDYKTGDSLCYAFIEFETNEACERAYFKLDNALIDDRRIHVDFSQSVSKLWNQFRRKGTQQGGGCFKCGSPDHIAKNCTGGSTLPQHQKYVLKDDNRQHGGERNAGYDMVFDEDVGSPKREKRHRDYEQDDGTKRSKSQTTGPDDDRWRKTERRDARERHRQIDRSHEVVRHGGRRDDRDHRERRDGSRRDERDHREKRDERDHRRRNDDVDRRDRVDDARNRKREKGADGDRRGEKENRSSGSTEYDHRHDDKREDKNDGHRRGADSDVRRGRREERDLEKRSSRDHRDREVDGRRQGERR